MFVSAHVFPIQLFPWRRHHVSPVDVHAAPAAVVQRPASAPAQTWGQAPSWDAKDSKIGKKKMAMKASSKLGFIKRKNINFSKNLYIILLHINLLHLSISNKWRGFSTSRRSWKPKSWEAIHMGHRHRDARYRVSRWRPSVLKSLVILLMVQKSCTSWCVVYPIINRVLYIPGGDPDFWTINSIASPKKKHIYLEDHPMTDVSGVFYHGDRFRPRFPGVMGPLPNGPNSRLINGGWSDHYLTSTGMILQVGKPLGSIPSPPFSSGIPRSILGGWNPTWTPLGGTPQQPPGRRMFVKERHLQKISSEDMARIHATIMYFGNFWDMLGELSLLTTVKSSKMRGFLENHRLRFQPFLPPLDEPQESNEFPVNHQNRMSRRSVQNWSKWASTLRPHHSFFGLHTNSRPWRSGCRILSFFQLWGWASLVKQSQGFYVCF